MFKKLISKYFAETIYYVNFVTGTGDGLDVELVKLFAESIDVRYEYVKTSWDRVIGDLTGKKVRPQRNDVEIIGKVPVRGDIIANGMTVLPWRQKVVSYSSPTFPNQVWLIARADSPLKPISPSENVNKDIAAVKRLIKGHSVMGKAGTCLDPSLYGIRQTGAFVKLFNGTLNELAPAILNEEAEATLLDVPDALIALEKWTGKIKVIGPVSPNQKMACAFARTAPDLRNAFDRFYCQCKEDGTYRRLVKKYYPGVFAYYPDFFK